MCSACGFPTRPGHWTDAGAQASSDKLRLRYQRIEILNRILSNYGFSAHYDGMTPGIQLKSFTGRTVILPDLEALWAEAERQHGAPIDPLAPQFTGKAA